MFKPPDARAVAAPSPVHDTAPQNEVRPKAAPVGRSPHPIIPVMVDI